MEPNENILILVVSVINLVVVIVGLAALQDSRRAKDETDRILQLAKTRLK